MNASNLLKQYTEKLETASCIAERETEDGTEAGANALVAAIADVHNLTAELVTAIGFVFSSRFLFLFNSFLSTVAPEM